MAEDKRPPGAPPPRPAPSTARPAPPPSARPPLPRPAAPRTRPTPSKHQAPRPPVVRAGLAARLPRLSRPERPSMPPLPWRALLLWPVALSALVTMLRLAGELLRWPDTHFSRLPGGGLATVGITWLVPAVGFWIGWKLNRSGYSPEDAARAAWLPLVALVAGWGVAALLGRVLDTSWTANLLLWALASLLATAVAVVTWPAAGQALLAYAMAARGLVVAVMAVAIARGWGTHYDALPPGYPPGTTRLARFLLLGLLPQLTIWIAFTVAIGLAFAALGRAAAGRRPPIMAAPGGSVARTN